MDAGKKRVMHGNAKIYIKKPAYFSKSLNMFLNIDFE